MRVGLTPRKCQVDKVMRPEKKFTRDAAFWSTRTLGECHVPSMT